MQNETEESMSLLLLCVVTLKVALSLLLYNTFNFLGSQMHRCTLGRILPEWKIEENLIFFKITPT